jgi:glycosyltransferase involved in cell wall biosynthesis
LHDSVRAFVKRAMPEREIKGKHVLEVGSRDVNGSVRLLFSSAASYVGVDVVEGPGVDLVADASDLRHLFPERFDIVVSTEMLEHAEDWRAALQGMKDVLKPRGRLVLTTRSPGFPHHEPPDHWRFSVATVRKALTDFDVNVEEDPEAPGVLVVGIKAGRKSPDLSKIRAKKAPPEPLPVHFQTVPPEAYFYASQRYGGGVVRSFWPAEELARRGWRVLAEDIPPSNGDWGTVVIHRPLDAGRKDNVAELKAHGARVLVDEDDDLNRVAESKNSIAAEVWDEERRRKHDDAIRASDGVIVTTDALAELYGPLAPEVHMVPNALPAWVGRQKFHKMPRDTSVRVGWTGIIRTHLADLEWIRPVAQWMLEGATFTTVGDVKTSVVLQVNSPVERFPWQMHIKEMYHHMARADIGIVPLLPSEFNRAKSYLKALEFMMLGKPVVVTDLPEQRKLVTNGVEGFLASSPEDFAERVRQLVRDSELRQRMAKAARERAQGFTLEARIGDWEKALGVP